MRHYTNTDNPIDFPKSALKHAEGNLIDMAEAGEFNIIVQGCNCFNTMGGGIAREIAKRYPAAVLMDNETEKGDYNKLGNYTLVYPEFTNSKFLIINAYTQYNMSRGDDVFEYTAFEMILQKLARHYPICDFGFPYIGMGLAGGNSNWIVPMLEAFAEQVEQSGGSVTLVKFA
jgi:O-acetyl-ADP-ribose deacetylase (regulator of RNase III)